MDSSGNNNFATLLDGLTWSTDPDHRGILLFDGTDDHAYIDGTPFELPLYSVTLWFRIDGGTGTRDILSAKGPTGVNGILFKIQGDGTLRYLHWFPFASGGGNNIYSVDSYDDPSAVTVSTWMEWVIPLQAFADRGINLTNVDKIAIGLGTKGDATAAGGSGTIFIDDIRLYRP